MKSKPLRLIAALSILAASSAGAAPFVFDNGNVDATQQTIVLEVTNPVAGALAACSPRF